MQTALASQSLTYANERTYASFWKRVGASMIDSIVLWFAFTLASATLAPNLGEFTMLLPIIATAMYVVIFTAGGATLGKKAVGISVTDSLGNPPGYSRAIRRYTLPLSLELIPLLLMAAVVVIAPDDLGMWIVVAVSAVLATVVIGFLDVIWMTWDTDNQTIHDKIAGTFVIQGQIKSSQLNPGQDWSRSNS